MKPRPANPNDLRTPDAPKPDAPKDSYNPLGLVITTVVGTTLIVGTMWMFHQNYLKSHIAVLKKDLEESRSGQDNRNTNS